MIPASALQKQHWYLRNWKLSSSQRVSNALLFAANKVERYSYMGCCLQIEESTKLFFFVPESIPRDRTVLCSTLDPASMLCYDTAHDISETYFAENLTEKLSFNCGQEIKKNVFLLHRKENKTTKLCTPEVMLRCICFCLSACGKVTEPVFFDYLGTATSCVSHLAKQWRCTFRYCGDQHAT